jgi:hypothetical protein
MDATIEQIRFAAGGSRWDMGPAGSLERRLIDFPTSAHVFAAWTGTGAGGSQ